MIYFFRQRNGAPLGWSLDCPSSTLAEHRFVVGRRLMA